MHIKSTVSYYDLYYFIFAIVIIAIFLHYTIKAYDVQIMDKNPKSGTGFTPLHWAAQEGHLDIWKIFLNREEK